MKDMPGDELVLDGTTLTIDDVHSVSVGLRPVRISQTALTKLEVARKLVFELAERDEPIYGFNRGVGWNKDRKVDANFFESYNRNLLLSHSAGVKPEANEYEVRAVMLARLNGLLLGHTGVQPLIAQRYAEFLNLGIHPVLPLRGSVGASDITVISHIGLALIGEGEVHVHGVRMPASAALAQAGLAPISMGPKDGLAVVSSNALSAGLGALGLYECRRMLELADMASALSLEALRGNLSPLDPAVHHVRPYAGQLESLGFIRSVLEASDLWGQQNSESLQDPLSFRDACQVNGAARDALSYAASRLETQLNSSDDNPCLLIEERRIISCANFDPLVWVLGFEMLGSALYHVSRCSSYRTLKLGNPAFTGLTRFLTADESHSIGLCTVQKTVTSIDAEIRHLSNPASADYASLAGDIEDHGTNAPYVVSKTREIVDRLCYVIAIELIHAAQAIDLRGDIQLGRGTRAAYEALREQVSFLSQDRELTSDIERAYRICKDGSLLEKVRQAISGDEG
ncbi:HAL/PAL/TAL family ammonia-lyase [Paenibacillus sp. MMO-177]|uniref:HAL/PAL/TAL family ammonia-lyase n=1 Tax=Paenibacillus sp. MMO-177 TaxID=3081289 RepID=UPI00301A5543